MGFLEKLRSMRGRAGWTGRHLIDPHGKPVAANSGNREGRHQHRGQEQKRKDFHAPAARPSICVVASGGHAVSHAFEFWNWTASGPLPCGTLSGGSAAALIWIKRPAYRGPESGEGHRRTRGRSGGRRCASARGLFRQAEFFEAGLGSAGEYTAQNNKPVAGETS